MISSLSLFPAMFRMDVELGRDASADSGGKDDDDDDTEVMSTFDKALPPPPGTGADGDTAHRTQVQPTQVWRNISRQSSLGSGDAGSYSPFFPLDEDTDTASAVADPTHSEQQRRPPTVPDPLNPFTALAKQMPLAAVKVMEGAPFMAHSQEFDATETGQAERHGHKAPRHGLGSLADQLDMGYLRLGDDDMPLTTALRDTDKSVSSSFGTPREFQIVQILDVDLVNPVPAPQSDLADPSTSTMVPTPGSWTARKRTTASASLACVRRILPSDFQIISVIGKGAYGKVFLVRKLNGIDRDQYYAMKVLRKAHLVLQDKDKEQTSTERSILEAVRHPFIVRLFYAFQTNFKLYLILDYAPGGELFTYLDKEKILLEDQAVFYMAELVLALEHLHRLGIIYRDLKPENVLLDGEGHVKLTDFGLSKVALSGDGRANTVCGTVEYMAPEALANQPYDKSVDWWSMGALSYDMMTGNPPFVSSSRKKTMDLIMNKKLTFPHFLSLDAKDLLTKLMRKQAHVRLGFGPADATSIKAHRFFRKMDWNALANRQSEPPFRPKVTSAEDVANFHSDFTSMPPVDSPTDGFEERDMFQGFSYVAESVLNRPPPMQGPGWPKRSIDRSIQSPSKP